MGALFRGVIPSLHQLARQEVGCIYCAIICSAPRPASFHHLLGLLSLDGISHY
jgi:hypothetical protein